MTDLSHPAEERRHVSRRSFLRGTILVTAGSALLAACTATPPFQPGKSATPARPAEAPKLAIPTAATTPAPAASKPAGAPKTGGTLIVAKAAEVTDLDPQL